MLVYTKMKTIAVVNQKGGSGKTTLAIHLAVAWATAGHNTAIIDLDPQASAAKWGDRREAELPVVLSAHASRLQKEQGRVAAKGGEFLVLDTAPQLDSAALAAARQADLVLVPCRPAILDLEAVTNTLGLISTTGKPILVVMNAVGAKGTEATEAAAAIGDIAEVCPVQLVNRVIFARALLDGRVAQEVEPKGKAALEMAELHAFICARVQE